MSESIIHGFRKRQEQEVERVTDYIVSGNCESYAEYLAKVHEIRAYKRARNNFDEAVIDFNREEEPEKVEEDE